MMEIVNLIAVAVLTPLAVHRLGSVSTWFLVLVTGLCASILAVGLLQPITLALLALLIYAALISLARSATAELRYIGQHIQRDVLRSIVWGTLLRWSVFPLIILLGYLSYQAINQSIHRAVSDTVYTTKIGTGSAGHAAYACSVDHRLVCECVAARIPGATANVTPSDCPQDSYAVTEAADRTALERDVHFSVDRFFTRLKAELQAHVSRILKSGGAVRDTSRDELLRALFDGPGDEVLFSQELHQFVPGLEPPPCAGFADPLFNMGDCIRHEVYATLDTLYASGRQRLRRALVSLLRRVGDSSRATSQDIRTLTATFVDQEIETLRAEYHQRVGELFQAARIFNIVSFLVWLGMALLVALLGFFYIFCRYAYDPRNGGVPLKLLLGPPLGSSLRSTPLVQDMSRTDLGIQLDQQTWFVNHTRYIELDSREDYKFPQPTKLFFRRFPSRLWMRQYSRQSGCTEIGLNFVGGGTQVVKVNLGRNDRVAFDLKNLVGFTESTSLATLFSWKLAYLLNRSPFICCAAGPGELLLSTKWQQATAPAANASACDDEQENAPLNEHQGRANPRDIALLDLNGQYSLSVSQSPLNVYWDDHSVESPDNSIILRDRSENGRRITRAAGFLRKMLLVPLPVLSGIFFIPLMMGWLSS